MAELLLVQALALGLASVHWSPLDLAPPLVMGLVRVLVLESAQAEVQASDSALQKALA
jgi:hypothetical protein